MSTPSGPAAGDHRGDHPGAALGLPAHGPASLASLWRRGLAAIIDWVLSQLIVIGLFDISVNDGGANAFAPLGLFLVMHLVLVGTIGTTIGHKVVGIEVRALDAGPPSPKQTVIRTGLVALFFPAILTASDGRGLHDKAAGTMTIRTR